MKTKLINIYECEYCGKYYKKKHFAIRHENICTKNPDNWRACHECYNVTKKKVSTLDKHYGSDKTFYFLYCKEKEIFIHPPKVEKLGNNNNFNSDGTRFESVVMPKECDRQKFFIDDAIDLFD